MNNNYETFNEDPELKTKLAITKRLDQLKFSKWHVFLVISLGKFFLNLNIFIYCLFLIYFKFVFIRIIRSKLRHCFYSYNSM